MSSIIKKVSSIRTATGGIERSQTNTEVDGVPVDELGRSKELRILSCQRPWSRGFHFSWLSFFVAFTGWFAIAPAMEYLISTGVVTRLDAKTSNIISVAGTIIVRFALGPICEIFGPRRPQATLLIGGGILVMLSSQISNNTSLWATRFFIGLVGGAFVPCQYWTSMLFSKRVVGSANAFAGGWGNLGGGFALLFVSSIIRGILASGVSEELAWRYAMLVPGSVMILVAIPMIFMSDDCPQGHWNNRLYNDPTVQKQDVDLEAEKKNPAQSTSQKSSTVAVWTDYRVWIMAVVYAGCFGVELAINNSMSGYLYRYMSVDGRPECLTTEIRESENYGESGCAALGVEDAALIASLFGLMNLFARAIGGVSSDYLFHKMGMRGRLVTLFVCLFGQGVMLIIFSRLSSLAPAIVCLILFSVFVQSSEGATFALVPFVNKQNIGNVAGIVGAGGNIGAVSWSTMFREVPNLSEAYLMLGGIIIGISFLVALIPVQGVYVLGCNSEATAEVMDEAETASEASEDLALAE